MTAMSEVRADIQGLRAVAVLCVIAYHIWPEVLPGGFVGVDVFFVISGFLISSNLLRELDATGSINMLKFYLKRARRLLPASIVVIAATVVASIFLLPANEWADTAQQAIASLFYFQNWQLVWNSVDYLAAEADPSPFQHFWSLSVEEQFYLFWPPLILAGFLFPMGRAVEARFKVALAMAILLSVSLLLSALLSSSGSAAYFGTHTRLWELAAGGLLAATRVRCPIPMSAIARAMGVAFIAWSAFFFSAATVFPGLAALLPTVGAMLIISARKAPSGKEPLILGSRLLGYIGDISYSLYLWHWPIIILTKGTIDQTSLGFGAGIAVVVASGALSVATKRYVEDYFRTGSRFPARRELALFLGSLAVPFVSSVCIIVYVHEMGAIAIDPAAYPGGRVLSGEQAPDGVGYYPDLSAVLRDRSDVYDNGCHLKFADAEPKGCAFGDGAGKQKVFLVGDSHAVNWLPALTDIALRRQWSGTSFTKSSCPLQPFTMTLKDQPYNECSAWVQKMLSKIESEKPNLVVIGYMAHFKLFDQKMNAADFETESTDFWRQIATHTKVVLIADTPEWPEDPNKCLASGKACTSPLQDVTGKDPIYEAALASGGIINVVNMNPYVCPDTICKPVVGNVRVWRDRHHLTATYSRSISGFLENELNKSLRGEPALAVTENGK